MQIKAFGCTGGYSRVTDFIRVWRDQEGKAPRAFVPLAFEWNDEGWWWAGRESQV